MKALKFTLKAWPVITAVTIGLCYLTQVVAGLFGVDLPEQAALKNIREMAGWNIWFAGTVAHILVGAPILEEALFRGLLFRVPSVGDAWRSRGARLVVAAVASSVLFAFVHYIDFPRLVSGGRLADGLSPLNNAFLALWFFGFAQCWLYRRTDCFWAPVASHFFFNLTNLVLLFVLPV